MNKYYHYISIYTYHIDDVHKIYKDKFIFVSFLFNVVQIDTILQLTQFFLGLMFWRCVRS